MKEVVFWDNKLFECLIRSKELESTISDLLDTFECAKNDDAIINCCTDIYYQNVNGIYFSDWLYDKQTDPEFADIKRELSILLNKSIPIESEEYDSYLEIINKMDFSTELILCLKISNASNFFVYTPNRYWESKQCFLSKYINKDNFLNEAKGCFPNLFFHDNVQSSFNTLNSDFDISRPIIVKHLSSLNKYHYDSQQWCESGVDFRKISEEIQELYDIECSPQSNRASVRNLYFEFINIKTKQTESLCCELHTKIKWHNMDRENQDRIYFHPGKKDIQDNKVLIAYIGTHI